MCTVVDFLLYCIKSRPTEETALLRNGEQSVCKKVCMFLLCTCCLKTEEQKTRCRKIGAVSVYVCILCTAAQMIEAILVLYKRAHPAIACIQSKNGTSIAVQQSLDVEYDFYYLGCYGFIGILHILQYFLLGRGLWNLANGLDEKMKKAYKAAPFYRLPCRSLKGLLLLLMLLTALVYFALGL